MQYSRFIFAGVSFIVILTADVFVPLFGQENPPEKADWEIQRDLYPARKTVQGRFGAVQFGSLTPNFDYSRQRLNGGAVFGSNNRLLGLDTMSPTSRIRPQTVEEAVIIQRPAQDEPSRYKVAPSANTIAPAAVPTVRTLSAQRQPNFFEQPGIMGGEVLAETPVPEGKQPIEQRWFRDIDAMGRNNSGYVSAPKGAGFGGEAVAVGGMQSDNTSTLRGIKPPASLPNVAPPISPRNFERQLEEMVLTSPGVHLLSPVQVTYQNGTATIRGVVANQQNKVDAGKVLLNVQGVKQVSNQLTVVPLDPVRLPVIEPK